MKRFHDGKRRAFVCVLVSLVMLFCMAVPASAEQYEEAFQEMTVEELQALSETISRIINEKKIGSAVLIADPAETTVAVGKTVKLAVTSDEREVTPKTQISYTSSDESVAKVNKGVVTGVAEGTAEIRISALFEDGATLETTCTVHVYVPVTALKAPPKATAFIDGEMNLAELVTITPENATEKKIIYEVDDESIVSVDENGTLKGHKGGNATVTISSAQENPAVKPAVVKVSVDEAVSSIKLDSEETRVAKGQTCTLKATVGPESATNKDVEWISSNPKIASVSAAGIVSGKATGNVVITCKAKDGSGVETSAKVTVYTSVTAVKIPGKYIEMMKDETTSVSCEVAPKDASNKKMKWTSSRSSVASVDDNGRISAKGTGTCTITATAADGSGKSASIDVYVEPKNPVEVNSIHWQTTWGMKNGKMGVYGTNLCNHRRIKDFTCKVECTSWYGGSTTDYVTYSGSMIAPGKQGRGRLSSFSVSGFSTAASIKITVVSVIFDDGTEYYIPSSEQRTTYFSM